MVEEHSKRNSPDCCHNAAERVRVFRVLAAVRWKRAQKKSSGVKPGESRREKGRKRCMQPAFYHVGAPALVSRLEKLLPPPLCTKG